jgi:hypothetical protein
MTSLRRVLPALGTSLLVVPLLVAGTTAHTAAPDGRASAARTTTSGHVWPAATAVAWQRIAIRTIYAEGALAPPVGGLYLAFTSRAVHDAALGARHRGRVVATAAVATAAHDVLEQYFPASDAALDADLASTMATLPTAPWAAARVAIGTAIGASAADTVIASRVDDGRGDPSIVYTKSAAPGVWPASGPGGMSAAWLGFVDPVIDVEPVALNGPDALTSPGYAKDYNEVRRLGSATSTDRTPRQTAIALFFVPNAVVTYRDALCRYLDEEPLGLLATTRLFARIDVAVATTFIEAWRLKFDVGFWRPFQAIAGAATDGNDATKAEVGWAPLVPNPTYSDYTSGHAAGTSPFAEVVRRTLGDHVPLVLRAVPDPTTGVVVERSYATLTSLEHDALHARIWGGLHFRDAMRDGYLLGHTTARRVMRALH